MNEKLRVYIRICRVFLYELAAWSYIVSHQHGEDIVYVGGIVNCYLFQNTRFRVHCCFPQLFGIHLTQTFVSLCMDSVFLSVTIFLNECLACFFGVAVFTDFSFAAFIQWRIGNVQMSVFYNFRHIAVEQCHDKGVDVRTIDIGIGHHFRPHRNGHPGR